MHLGPRLAMQQPDLAVELDWEVAPNVDRTWRRMVSKMVTDVVDNIEAVSVVSNIVEADIGTSYVEGEVLAILRQIERNDAVKSSIRKKLEEEDEEERLLVEAQGRAERRMRQEVARNRWLSG